MKFKEYIKDVEQVHNVIINLIKFHKIPTLKTYSYKKDSVVNHLFDELGASLAFYTIVIPYENLKQIEELLAKILKRSPLSKNVYYKDSAFIDLTIYPKSVSLSFLPKPKNSVEILKYLKKGGIKPIFQKGDDSQFYLDEESTEVFDSKAEIISKEKSAFFFFFENVVIRRFRSDNKKYNYKYSIIYWTII